MTHKTYHYTAPNVHGMECKFEVITDADNDSISVESKHPSVTCDITQHNYTVIEDMLKRFHEHRDKSERKKTKRKKDGD
jgi:hypothetical protein